MTTPRRAWLGPYARGRAPTATAARSTAQLGALATNLRHRRSLPVAEICALAAARSGARGIIGRATVL
jgi:hypothetical protein